MIDQTTAGEESESVKQFEDGVTRLVDGHHHNPVFGTSHPKDY